MPLLFREQWDQEDPKTSRSFRIVEPTHEPSRPGLKLSPAPLLAEGLSSWGSLDSWQALLATVVFRQDLDGRFLEVSPQIEKLSGIPSQEWLEELEFWDCVHPADLERVQRHFAASKEAVEVQTLDYRLCLPGQGKTLTVSERRRGVPGRLSPGIFEGAWTDITSLTQAEQRMPSCSWQRALASLTPGVTHDLNNHFSSILAISDGFVRRSTVAHPFYEGSATIRDSVQQAAKLLQKLVAVHLIRPGEWRYHTLNELLGETLDFLRHSISRRISFQRELTPQKLPVYLDAVEFRRALIALVKNTVDAIANPGSGSLKFEMRFAPRAPLETADPVPEHSLGFAVITVEDNGPGVPESMRSQLFNPWFSTKPPTEGAGLGLYSVREFARRCGGGVRFAPAADGGAAFSLWLPVSDLNDGDRRTRAHVPLTYLIGTSPQLEDTAQSLREIGLSVIASDSDPTELLQSEDEGPDAVCLLQEAAPRWMQSLSRLIRSRRWNTRILCEHPALQGPPPYPDGVKPDLSIPAPLGAPSHHTRIRALLMPPP